MRKNNVHVGHFVLLKQLAAKNSFCTAKEKKWFTRALHVHYFFVNAASNVATLGLLWRARILTTLVAREAAVDGAHERGDALVLLLLKGEDGERVAANRWRRRLLLELASFEAGI